jgi:hypothetical protein
MSLCQPEIGSSGLKRSRQRSKSLNAAVVVNRGTRCRDSFSTANARRRRSGRQFLPRMALINTDDSLARILCSYPCKSVRSVALCSCLQTPTGDNVEQEGAEYTEALVHSPLFSRVRPQDRSQGVGQQLLNAIAEAGRAKGWKLLEMTGRPGRGRAVVVFSKLLRRCLDGKAMWGEKWGLCEKISTLGLSQIQPSSLCLPSFCFRAVTDWCSRMRAR